MIFLRAFPFSFSIFWRLLLVSPLIMMALALATLFAIMAGVLLLSFLPPVIVGVLSFGFSMGMVSVPLLIGTRIGLTFLGHEPRNGYGGLIGYATMYGLGVGLASTVVTSLLLGLIGLLVGRPLQNLDFANSVLSGTGGMDTVATLVMIISFAVPACMYAAALLPMAASSVGTDPHGQRHTPFVGTGRGFVSLIALIAVSQIVLWLATMAFGAAINAATALDARLLLSPVAFARFLSSDMVMPLIGLIVVYITVVVATLSLQCAGVVLVYQDDFDASKARKKVTFEPVACAEVAADMWRSRMKPLK